MDLRWAGMLAGVLLAWTGCSLDGYTTTSPETQSSGTGTPVSSQHFDQSGLTFSFSTNDAIYKGTTVLRYTNTVTSGAYTYTASVSKTSGQSGGGIGLIFQRQNDQNFWLADVDTQGSFTLAKMVSGTWEYVSSWGSSTWKSSPAVHAGLGIANTLSITYNGVSSYSFFINGTDVIDFTDSGMGTVYTSGNLGINVGVLSNENFPATPVAASFTIQSPSGLSW